MNKAYIFFDIRDYHNSHLRKPRGRGLWLFQIGAAVFEHNGTYAEARKAAAEAAREAGHKTVVVLP